MTIALQAAFFDHLNISRKLNNIIKNILNFIILFNKYFFNYTYNSQEAINETSTTLLPQIYITATKNNHTTSTKCQYHAAASKPK
jgi:hypothetical protein